MNPGEVTRKTLIREAIEKADRASTLSEISKAINVSPTKINQSLTTFDFSIVRIGPETYDLPSRFYKGRSFRVSPGQLEINKGIIRADEELPIFLASSYHTFDPVFLVDEDKSEYLIRTIKYAKTASFEYYKDLNEWFKKYNFQFGDDIIFTCLSYQDKKYLIKHIKKSDRDEKLISLKNKILADYVYKIILMTIYKYEDIMFLFRKYMFTFPFNDDIPPDPIFNALLSDHRFVLSTRDRILNHAGQIIEAKIIGLSKYYFDDKDGNKVLVEILSDEFGKFGSCSLCNERMIWEPNSGWRHCKDDMEWADTEIPKEFFKLDKLDRIKN